MRRRAFIAGLGGAAVWPVVARGQQSGKAPRIGILWHAANEQEEAPFLGAFRQGLNDLGYVEGKNIELINRFADEHYDRFDGLAKELVDVKVDLIVASILSAALAAKKATTSIPIVFVLVPDPVAQHVVDTLAHPGGNLTGPGSMMTDLIGKNLEILKDCLPNLSSIALLNNPTSPLARTVVANAQSASRVANIEISIVDAGSPQEVKPAFSVIARQKPGAVIIGTDPMLYNERKQIAELAIADRLPTIAIAQQMVEAGLMLSYGPDVQQLFRQAAVYVGKILKGAKASDLPVERATKFNFAINLRTARSIGVAVPGAIQARADEVIE